MKQLSTLLLGLMLCLSINSHGQSRSQIKQVLELQVPREGGQNAAGVTWHPRNQKYYAAMAGNSTFSLAVYDNKGNLLSPVDQATLFDIRGIWFNIDKKTIQVNGYNEFGWAEYQLDKAGLPTSLDILFTGKKQPGIHNTGVYNFKDKTVLFFDFSREELMEYNAKTGEVIRAIPLFVGAANEEEDDMIILQILMDEDYDILDNYNLSSIIYTGIENAEIGFLNHAEKRIELYSIKTGFKTQELLLPPAAATSKVLNFSYANHIYWLFDKDRRVWVGYK